MNKQLEELEEQRLKEERILNEAQIHLLEARTVFKLEKKTADPRWISMTKNIIREKTAIIHSINRKIKELKLKNSCSDTYDRNFRLVAEQVLSEESLCLIRNSIKKGTSNVNVECPL